jgi:hypothetical protein
MMIARALAEGVPIATSRVLKKCRFWRVLPSAVVGIAVVGRFL